MLPKLLTSRLETLLGPDYSSVLDAYKHQRMGSFRINSLKSTATEVLDEFSKK